MPETERDQTIKLMSELGASLQKRLADRRDTDYEGRLNDLQSVFSSAIDVSNEGPELL